MYTLSYQIPPNRGLSLRMIIMDKHSRLQVIKISRWNKATDYNSIVSAATDLKTGQTKIKVGILVAAWKKLEVQNNPKKI